MATFRAFIALELPVDLANHVANLQKKYKKLISNPKIRWLPVQNIHLTLKFLGDTDEFRVPEINQCINSACADTERISVNLKAIELFPHSYRPSGIWIRLDATPQLFSLKEALDDRLAFLGISKNKKKYFPHLSIARFRRGITKSEFRKIDQYLSIQNTNLLQSVVLDELTLFQSDLHPKGAIYSKRFTCLLS